MKMLIASVGLILVAGLFTACGQRANIEFPADHQTDSLSY